MSKNISIIGKGNVGSALAEGFRRAGNEVRFGSKVPKESTRDVSIWADVVILAVPWDAHAEIAKSVGNALE
jgi:predicted dinucleotide-binding enzyme